MDQLRRMSDVENSSIEPRLRDCLGAINMIKEQKCTVTVLNKVAVLFHLVY